MTLRRFPVSLAESLAQEFPDLVPPPKVLDHLTGELLFGRQDKAARHPPDHGRRLIMDHDAPDSMIQRAGRTRLMPEAASETRHLSPAEIKTGLRDAAAVARDLTGKDEAARSTRTVGKAAHLAEASRLLKPERTKEREQ
jgi:hypothetical protein